MTPPETAPSRAETRQVPSVGRIVHVKLDITRTRAGIITEVIEGDSRETCSVTVFMSLSDRNNPALMTMHQDQSAQMMYLQYDPSGDIIPSWHWPEFVPPAKLSKD